MAEPTSENNNTTPLSSPQKMGKPGMANTSSGSSWVPASVHGKKTKGEQEVVDLAVAEPGVSYEWDDKLGAYVPSKSSGETSSASSTKTASDGSSSETSTPVTHRHKRHPKADQSSDGSSSDQVTDLDSLNSVPSRQSKTHNGAGGSSANDATTASNAPMQTASSGSTADNVPSTEDLLTTDMSTKDNGSQGAAKSKKHKKSSTQNSTTDVASATSMPATEQGSAVSADQDSHSTMTPSEIAALTKKLKTQEQSDSGSSASPNGNASVPDTAAPPPDVESTPTTTMTPSERAAADAARRGPPTRDSSGSPQTKVGSSTPAPAYDAALDSNQQGHGALASDQWHPKQGAPAPAEDETAPPVQVAMMPKNLPPPDTSADGLMKIAAEGQGAVPNEGDRWKPQATKAVASDQDVTAEINRLRAERQAPPPPVKVKRDINNPEEGVLPVNSFERFSGPRYGRHREYERRFNYGKRAKAMVSNYDFYVDEVDRKKEIHNIYYYQKGKAPKLVAIERHSHVTFLDNYDVDTEDKGKVTKY